MNSPNRPSFRRILLLRIIIVSIPVLLIGVAVAFRQARITFQESAEKNLSESAERKAETIESTINAVQTSLVSAAESLTLRTGTLEEAQGFLDNLSTQMPLNVSCVQLADGQTGTPLAGTCDTPLFGQNSQQETELGLIDRQWPQDRSSLMTDRFYIHALDVQTQVAPDTLRRKRSQLNLVLSTPVYDASGQLRHVLLAQGNLTQQESNERRSLLGFTVVLDTRGTILAHPLPEQVGQNIAETMDAARFREIVQLALDGNEDVSYLYNFSDNTARWLAGYSVANVAVSPTEDETLVVLAVAQLSTALYGLNNIKRIVILLTGALTIAHLIAMAYMARDLARPIEELGDYASLIHDRRSNHDVPQDFRFRELNQLSIALNNMLTRLENRAQELESAWKQAQAANKLKDEILAVTSHELRTPLNAISNSIQFVRNDMCDSEEEKMEWLETADKVTADLLQIINNMLDLASIEAGTFEITVTPTNLHHVIQSAISAQAREAELKGLAIQSHVCPAVEVQADGSRLKQVFVNLICNAIKFTDQGQITVRVEVQETAALDQRAIAELDARTPALDSLPAQWAVISVTDTGIGIAPDQQDKLFKPFGMVDGSKTRKYRGTGLGLSISKEFIRRMQGYISLQSEGLGHGTTAHVILPLVAPVPVEDGDLTAQDAAPNTFPSAEPVVATLTETDDRVSAMAPSSV